VKLYIGIGVALLLILQVVLWKSDSSLVDFFSLQRDIKIQIHDNQALIERNAALTGDVIDLKDGVEAIEERARNEMGLIKEGEVFYQVVKSKHES
jgi:cell division protein FtsB